MNEIDYGSVFGVEATDGVNESEPAEQTTAEATATEDAAGEKETEPAKQSAEENAKYAAARRKAEQERDAAIAQARAEAQRSIDDSIRALNIENPYTGRTIQSKAEYDAYLRQQAAEKRTQVAESAGMSEQEFDSFISNLPQVQDYRRAAEAARQQQQRMVLEEQIQEIAKLDPSISTVQDLMERPEYKQVYNLVRKGNSIVDAFKLVYFDKLTASAGNAGRQAALNAAGSKEHLQPTTARGAGSLTVPADVKAMYKSMMPDATDAEIQEHYNKFHKRN